MKRRKILKFNTIWQHVFCVYFSFCVFFFAFWCLFTLVNVWMRRQFVSHSFSFFVFFISHYHMFSILNVISACTHLTHLTITVISPVHTETAPHHNTLCAMHKFYNRINYKQSHMIWLGSSKKRIFLST